MRHDNGILLALGAAAALAGLAVALPAGGSGNRPTADDLEAALRGGSFNAVATPRQGRKLRPWEMFLRMDPADVPDDLVVAILLAGGRGDPVEEARKLLAAVNGSIGQVAVGSFPPELKIGDARRARVIAASELARRAQVRQTFTVPKPVFLTGPQSAADLLQRISAGPVEKLSALYLSRRNAVIGYRDLSKGASHYTVVDPIEVFRPAIQLRAAGIIMAHQHPSGDAEPSREDKEVTSRVKKAGDIIGIKLLDHMIIGAHGKWTSLAERGELW